MNEEINIRSNSSNGDRTVSGNSKCSFDAETRLRGAVTAMLCKGIHPDEVAEMVRKDKYCTAITKRRILTDIHRWDGDINGD